MAISSGAQAGRAGRGRRGRGKRQPMSEINMTPMVDVMLVLLIIFMVSAPLMTVGVPLDLPKTQAKVLNADTQPITISVQADGRVFVQEEEVQIDGIVELLKAISQTGYEERIFVRADQAADYGSVMRVMARISAAGYTNIGLVTAQDTQS